MLLFLGKADAASARASNISQRQRIFVLVMVGTVLISVGGLFAASWIKSPADQAARTAPPPASVLTTPASRQVLASTLLMRGTVRAGRQYDVTPVVDSTDVKQAIVSGVRVKLGDSVGAGKVLLEVSGQPLVVLPGEVPAYRDFIPRSTGPDIAELQRALAIVGYVCGRDRQGWYGPGTGEALRRFLRSIGYPFPTMPPAQPDSIGKVPAGTPANPQAPQTQALGSSGDPRVPAGVFLFLPTLPAKVKALGAGVGMPVHAPLISLTSGGFSVKGHLDLTQAAMVKPGMKVNILVEESGAAAAGNVGSVGAPTTVPDSGTIVTLGGSAEPARPMGGSSGLSGESGGSRGGSGTATAYVPITIVPTTPLGDGFLGKDVRLTVETASTGTPVLTVPAAAVFTTASGRTLVTKALPDGRQINVTVMPGVSANGYIQVTPVDGTLVAGERVVVGR